MHKIKNENTLYICIKVCVYLTGRSGASVWRGIENFS